MKTGRRPVYKWGMVNYECPDYEKCFAHAFELHWEFWSCSKCPENEIQKTSPRYSVDNPRLQSHLPHS